MAGYGPIAHGVRRAPLLAMLAGSGVSLTGNSVALVAIPWFVLESTGSAALTGLTAAATVLPNVISGALAGVLVDRVGHRRASVLADLTSALAVALIPLLHLTVGLAVWQIIVLVFMGALLDVPGFSARQALLPDLAERARMPLERANSLNSAVHRGSQLAGPLLAGVLITTAGVTWALWLNAATFLISAVVIAAFVPRPERTVEPEPVTYLQQLRRGLRFLREDPVMRFVLLLTALSNLLASPVFAVGLPVYAKEVLQTALGLGVVLASLATGALVGTLGYAAFGHRLPRRATLLLAFLLSGAPLGLLAFIDSLPIAALVLALVGLAAGPLNPLISTLVQERTASGMRAQMFGTVIAVAWVAMPVGMLLAGTIAELFGVRALFIGVGVAFLVLLALIWPNQALRELDRAGERAET